MTQASVEDSENLKKFALATQKQMKYAQIGMLVEMCGLDTDQISEGEMAGWLIYLARARANSTDQIRDQMRVAGQPIIDAIEQDMRADVEKLTSAGIEGKPSHEEKF